MSLARLSLRSKLLVSFVLGLVLLLVAMLAVVRTSLSTQFESEVAGRLENVIALLRHDLGAGAFAVEGGKLVFGTRDLGRSATDTAGLTGATLVLFAGDKATGGTAAASDGFPGSLGPSVRQTVLVEGRPLHTVETIGGDVWFAYYEPLKDSGGKPVGAVASFGPKSNFDAWASAITWRVVGFAVPLVLVIGGLFTWMVARMFHALADIQGAMTALAGNDLSVAVPHRGREDEVGHMAAAVEVFKENAVTVRALQRESEERGALAEARARSLTDSALAFEASAAGVSETLTGAAGRLHRSARGMSQTAESTAQRSAVAATAADSASHNVETVSAAAEELTASIREISRQVQDATGIAGTAVREAASTNETVAGLASAGARIGEVIKLISDIASQTNLLALNATIEAARAGEAGKGFAVVATEVKNLAGQTAKATEEIQSQVQAIQGETERAVGAIDGIAKTIGQISAITTSIAAAVEEQGAATQEIARNVAEAAGGTRDVSTNIASVTGMAGETGRTAGEVLGAADELTRQAETLGETVRGFLAQVRTA